MVFKRPGNSRDDRSGKAPNHYTKSTGGTSKSTSTGRRSSSSHTDRTASGRPGRAADGESTGRGKTFTSSGSKPFTKRPNTDDRPQRDANGSSFADKKTFSGGRSKPYSGRPTSDDRPKRSFGGESSGEKKPYSSDRKPYSGRPTSDDRPKRSFGGESSGENKPYSSDRKPYSGKPTGDDRPKRSFGGESSGDKKPYSSDRKPYSGRPTSDDRPKRSFGDESSGDRKSYRSEKIDKPAGDRKYGSGAGADFKDRPYRKPTHPRDERPASGDDKSGTTMRGRKKIETNQDKGLIRLNRYISNAGICSRRKADELIAAGVVSVNGEVVSELGHKVNPLTDVIRYNGETLKRERMVYVLLNKPKDYITTTDDSHERRTVMQLVEKASKERIYPIGRLDRNTTGLLLMTNDGDLADKLSHPKNNITKLYHVELGKALSQGDLNKIEFGLELEDGIIKPDTVQYVAGATKREVGIQIHSGKNRIVRRIFEHLGYEVVKLDRVVYANLTKKDLPRGRWRYLDEQEVIQLKHLI